MKTQLLALALLFPCVLKAQNCLSQKDQITGREVKSGTVILTVDSAQNPVQFMLLKSNEDLSVGLSMISTLAASSFDAGNMKLCVKFENGQVKSFNANGSTKVGAIGDHTVVGFRASATAEDLYYLQVNSVSQFILSYKGDENSGSPIPVSGLNAAKIRNSVICLSN